MSSTLENITKILDAKIAQDQALRVATPFTRMHTMGGTLVDMGAEQVSHEMYKGNRKVAPLVSRLVGGGRDADGSVIRPGTVGANDYLFSLSQQHFEVPSNVLNKRIPGESPYVRGTDEDVKNMRRQYWMMVEAMDAVRRTLYRNELLANQDYFDAEMNLGDTFQGATKLVYPRSAALKNRTVTTAWSTAATATPWADYGSAQRAIKQLSQIENGALWISFLSSDVMNRLRAIYRTQRSEGTGFNKEFYEFSMNPEEQVPADLTYLIENGCEYNGWIRTTYSNSKVYLFTLPEGYDASTTETTETYTDWITGEKVSIGLAAPGMFKAYYGPGILEPPENNVVERAVGRVGIPAIGDLTDMTIGNSGIPSRSMLLNIYDLGRNQGYGGVIEHGPMYAPRWADTVATISTETT